MNRYDLYRCLRCLLGSGLIATFLPQTPFAAPAGEVGFFPWTQGSSWTYKTTNKKKHEVFDMNVVMKEPWKDDSGSGMILDQHDSRGQMREFLLKREDGIFISKLGLSKSFTPELFTRFNPPVPRVILPLEPGHKVHWEGRLKVATVNKPIVFDGEVTGWEDIDVPAGHFHCLRLHFHEKRGEEVVDEDAWYADGVGQVKYEGGQYTKELKAYKIL